MDRQALLLHIEALREEIASARKELDGGADLYEPRIRELEEQLEDTNRMVVEIRKSIAASSRRRWQRWPVGWIAVALVVIAFFVGSR